MRAVIQRVKSANVEIDNKVVGEIKKGLLILIGVHQNDEIGATEKLAEKILKLRIFGDPSASSGQVQDKMNLSIQDVEGEILVVSQFTLYADTKKGNRPSFIDSAKPDKAIPIYNKFIEYLRKSDLKIESGEFGAMMDVELINDGPVTIIIEN